MRSNQNYFQLNGDNDFSSSSHNPHFSTFESTYQKPPNTWRGDSAPPVILSPSMQFSYINPPSSSSLITVATTTTTHDDSIPTAAGNFASTACERRNGMGYDPWNMATPEHPSMLAKPVIFGHSVDERGKYLSRNISELTIDPRAMTSSNFHLQTRPEESGTRDTTSRIVPGKTPLGVLMSSDDY